MTAAVLDAPVVVASHRQSATEVLGIDVSTAPSAHDALIHAGIAGLNVRKVGIRTDRGKRIPTQFGLELHDGTPLPVTVGAGFEVVQYETNADLLDAVSRRLEAPFGRAGGLVAHKGRAFLTMDLPEPIRIGDDFLAASLTAFMGHGRTGNHFVPGAMRVGCFNQQTHLMREGRDHMVTIRHTSSAPERTAVAEETLVATMTGIKELAAEGNEMVAAKVTDDQFWAIVNQIYPLGGSSKAAETRHDRRVESIENLRDAPHNANIRGTAWGTYQVLNEYSQWAQNIRAGLDGEQVARARRALISGNLHATQARTYTAVRELVGLAA